MRAIQKFLALIYMAVILVTLYVSIVISVFTSRYACDLFHYESFQKITCEDLFFGKRDVNENGEAWYCRVNEKEVTKINFIGAFFSRNAEFDDNEVWYNVTTRRIYKFTTDSLYDKLVFRILINCSVLFFFVILCIIGLSTKTIYED